jgi:uncharacterized membrane protein YvbJ
MTDIKTALSNAMNEWEEPKDSTGVKSHLFKTTNNVTRSTFNAVRDTPGCTRKAILFGLERQGFKLASTTSILSQMIKQRLVREEDDGTLYANFKDYVPLKATSKPKVKAKVKAVKDKPKKPYLGTIEAAPQPQAMGITKVQSAWSNKRSVVDMEEWLSEVPLMQARMVYVRLKEIFEGETK